MTKVLLSQAAPCRKKKIFKEDEKWEYIQRFLKLSGSGDVIQKRIDWLRRRNLCRLFVVKDQQGVKCGMTLAILSRENHTAYLWRSICDDLKLENEILPYLFWKSYEVLSEEFPCMDLGASTKVNIGLIKDQLGCEPAPRFITNFRNRHIVEKMNSEILTTD